jgi:hypothetical protein
MTQQDIETIETTAQFQQDVSDFNDEEIREKLDLLLTKYQSQDQIASNKNNIVVSSASLSQVDASQTLEEVIENEIPMLTEVVTLRSSPLRSILEAALDQTRIEMGVKDREELARALAKQLKESPINFGPKG